MLGRSLLALGSGTASPAIRRRQGSSDLASTEAKVCWRAPTADPFLLKSTSLRFERKGGRNIIQIISSDFCLFH